MSDHLRFRVMGTLAARCCHGAITVAILCLASILMVGCGKAKPAYDTSTPKAAANSLAVAIQSGAGRDDLKQLVIATDAELDGLVAMSQVIQAEAQYEAAYKAKFGTDCPTAAAVSSAFSSGLSKMSMTDATEADNGDTATLTAADNSQTVFKKDSSGWKFDVAASGGVGEPSEQADMKKWTDVFNGEAKNVSGGQYPTGSQAESVLKLKLQGAG